MGYVKIQDRDHLYRDINSGAILNTNKAEFEQYYADREIDMKKLQEKQALENKVNKLEEDIGQIKNLLQELVQMRNSNGN